jgi:hypothetical protein
MWELPIRIAKTICFWALSNQVNNSEADIKFSEFARTDHKKDIPALSNVLQKEGPRPEYDADFLRSVEIRQNSLRTQSKLKDTMTMRTMTLRNLVDFTN